GLNFTARRCSRPFKILNTTNILSRGFNRMFSQCRRCLHECPQLGVMDDLQVLNLQHNLITGISQLSLLRHLVVLNLDDNHITDMSGIQALTSLRILTLATNRIHQISCLDNLAKLHILDLHHNQISKMENLSHLTELQVLNLAGNNISRVENLLGLDSLMELNLRHNYISFVAEVDLLPRLRRLFLSCNNISCCGESLSLSELTLDGNPVALETWYKQAVLRCVLHLRQLDMKRITVSLITLFQVFLCGWYAVQNETSVLYNEPSHLNNVTSQYSFQIQTQNLFVQRGIIRSIRATLKSKSLGSYSTENSCSPGIFFFNLAEEALSGSVTSLSLSDNHLAELDGDTLRLFGLGALDVLERGWGAQTASAVTVIAFRYIHFDAIVPMLPRIRVKFPNLHLIFLETNISRLPQLAALAQVRRLDQLTIHQQGNPVVGLALWRSFVIYRLHHFNLQRINSQEVTMNDVIAAERIFGTLGHVAATETPHCRLLLLLEESRKRQLQFLLEGRGRRAGLSPEELRDNGKLVGEGLSRALFNYPSRDEASERTATVDLYLQDLVRQASETNVKGEALHCLWPAMFAEMVRDCVLEMSDRAAFRQASLAKLSK
uniref:Leucine rich repeat containing 49 n=1 Tax=Hippocampus comes TaxID=109280 RepID=A0A3Q3D1U6_HIPCM